MPLLVLPPTKLDKAVADACARAATPEICEALKVLTYAGDEHVLLALTAIMWVACPRHSARTSTRLNHFAITVAASAVLPHLFKYVIDQQRPDRRIRGPRNGIPKSGKPYDAFPSGHAVHMGALASAISRLFPRYSMAGWLFASVVSGTRVALLAHWLTDVLAGLAMGAALERAVAKARNGSMKSV